MDTTCLSLFASSGPYFPTIPCCLLVIIVAVTPLLLLAIAARSFLSGDPMNWGLVAVQLLGAAGLTYLLARILPDGFRSVPKIYLVWELAAIAAVLTVPPSLLYEVHKRGWLQSKQRVRRNRGRIFYE